MSNEDWNELDESYRSALSGALETAHPAVEQVGGDERAAFERAFTVQEGVYFDKKRGEYRSMNLREIEVTDAQDLNLRLQGWQARAALAQPSPAPADEKPGDSILCSGCFAKGVGPEHFDEAGKCLVRQQTEPLGAEFAQVLSDNLPELLSTAQAEQAEAERPPQPERYTADVFHPERPYYMAQTSVVRASDFDEFATQYERIVGALRAQIAEWQEAAGRGRSDVVAYIAERAKLLEGRDAALARVAELESKLAELEMQAPVAFLYRGTDMGDQLTLIRLDHYWRPKYSTEEHDYIKGIPLYAAPPAQAQHSVPELDQLYSMLGAESQVDAAKKIAELIGCRMSRSALTEAQMRRIYENSTEIENERLGFAAFARLMRRAEAVHQIAAAPGNSAQHSVPEGWMLVECGIWTQEQVDEMQKTVARFRNSEFVDDRALAMAVADAGQCKAPEISLAELLAAAPGKEGL